MALITDLPKLYFFLCDWAAKAARQQISFLRALHMSLKHIADTAMAEEALLIKGSKANSALADASQNLSQLRNAVQQEQSMKHSTQHKFSVTVCSTLLS